MAIATGLNDVGGIMLFTKGSATPTPLPTVVLVVGSKMLLAKIGCPRASMAIDAAGTPKVRLNPAPPFGEIAEKSPSRYAAVGTVSVNVRPWSSLKYARRSKKKKVLFFPL